MTEAAAVKVRILTGAGPLAVVGTDAGVSDIYFEQSDSSAGPGRRFREGGRGPADALDVPRQIPGPVRDAVLQLEQYFSGLRRTFDFKMQLEGTDFQRRVWDYLRTIPPGEIRTYGDVAEAVGRPRGARAVGGAVGRNPISIAIPCHRVVGADGRGGGYGGGMAAKRFLLRLEGAPWPGREKVYDKEGSFR